MKYNLKFVFANTGKVHELHNVDESYMKDVIYTWKSGRSVNVGGVGLVRGRSIKDITVEAVTEPICHAQNDGDCDWAECPQKKDGEPEASGRHCPLDTEEQNG